MFTSDEQTLERLQPALNKIKLRQEMQSIREDEKQQDPEIMKAKPTNPNKPYYDFRKRKDSHIHQLSNLEMLEKMKEIEVKQTSNNYLAKRNEETENLE